MPILNPNAFNKYHYEFSVKNTVSGTSIASEMIQFLELSQTGMTLSLPVNSCAEGHNLQVDMSFSSADSKMSFPFSAVVEQINRDKSGLISVKLKFRQYNPEIWERFLDHFGEQAKKTSHLFDRLKGKV